MDRHVEWKCSGEVIRGMLTVPASEPDKVAVFLHGWAGDRTGPGGIFRDAARSLCSREWASLRFDFRGRGDSNGETNTASIRSMTDDTLSAVAFAQKLGFRRLALLGICSGCKVAIATAALKPEVRELILWSAEAMGGLRTPAMRIRKSLAAIRTYARKLCSADAWRKILHGRVNTNMVRKAVLATESPNRSEQQWEAEMLRRFASFKGRILFVYGSNDPEMRIAGTPYCRFCAKHRIRAKFHTVQGATHSFYSLAWKQEVVCITTRWLTEDSAPGQ